MASSAGRTETERFPSSESSWIVQGCVLRVDQAQDSPDIDGFAENPSPTENGCF